MSRAVVVATLFALMALPGAAADQRAVRLTVRVLLVDEAGTATPVSRHGLLVSDTPPSAAPQRVVTNADGTAGLVLRPGSYIVESEQAVAFQGQAYLWIQPVDVVAGRDAVLELTADNAIVEPLTDEVIAAATGGGESPARPSPADMVRPWTKSVVAIWTPTGHTSGFVIDERGLIATSQRIVGAATSVEVQFSPSMKVAGRVLAADPARDVALVRVAASTVASLPPVPLDCTGPAMPLVDEQAVMTIGVPLRGSADIAFGTVRRVSSRLVGADFDLRQSGPGGPVFTEDGRVAGIASVANDDDADDLRGDSPIVSVDHACAAMQSVGDAMRDGTAPDDARLPVEAATAMPTAMLEDAVAKRAGSLAPYEMSSSDFDITFITPVLLYAALRHGELPTMDFGNWSDYVRSAPPVLLGTRDTEAVGELLDEDRPGRRDDAGRVAAEDHALQGGLFAPARVLRGPRGHPAAPVQARAARLRDGRRLRRSVGVRTRRARP